MEGNNETLFSESEEIVLGTDKQSHMQLSELTALVKGALDSYFKKKTFSVVAEITNLKSYDSGLYLELVEKQGDEVIAKVRANCWRNCLHRIFDFEAATGHKFINGIQVLLKVSVVYSPLHGLSLNIRDVDPSFTLGNIELQKRATIELLQQKDGVKLIDGAYVSANHSRKLPAVIQRIALLAAPNSDGFRDFMHELEYNEFGYSFTVTEFHARVQGAHSENDLLSGLRDIYLRRHEFDILVMVRGGGSDTDLAVFDTYSISKACALFPIPVFTGIGHTRNESIADLMVFRPLKTPTKVAQEIIEINSDFEAHVEVALEQIFKRTIEELTKKDKERVDVLQRIFLKCNSLLAAQEAKNENRITNIYDSAMRVLERANEKVNQQIEILNLLDPRNILKRGYALLTRGEDVISGVAGVAKGDNLKVELYDGDINVEVK